MDFNEIARFCSIPLQRLQEYEAAGFLRKEHEGDYKIEDVERLGLLEMLTQIGFDTAEIKQYLESGNRNVSPRRRIQLLRDKRCKILHNIHGNQALLDHIDYLIWNIKKEGKNF